MRHLAQLIRKDSPLEGLVCGMGSLNGMVVRKIRLLKLGQSKEVAL